MVLNRGQQHVSYVATGLNIPEKKRAADYKRFRKLCFKKFPKTIIENFIRTYIVRTCNPKIFSDVTQYIRDLFTFPVESSICD